MYIVRFSYDFLPAHRQQAISLIQREVEAARTHGLRARLLIPLTRAPGGASLHYEIELDHLDQFDDFHSVFCWYRNIFIISQCIIDTIIIIAIISPH